jgi:hypothetical protein
MGNFCSSRNDKEALHHCLKRLLQTQPPESSSAQSRSLGGEPQFLFEFMCPFSIDKPEAYQWDDNETLEKLRRR